MRKRGRQERDRVRERERELWNGENKGRWKEEGWRARLVERKRGERKSFDVFHSPERASGWIVDPKLALLLEGTDWFIKRSHRPTCLRA